MIETAQVQSALQGTLDPETGRPVTQTNQLKSIQCDDTSIRVSIGLTSHSAPLKKDVQDFATERLRQSFPETPIIEVQIVPHERIVPQIGQVGLRCRSVIAVGSGKGGVGKSTVATSLAYSLKKMGSRVGLMDADVYGPSVPQLTGTSGNLQQQDGKIQPMMQDGMPIVSIGFMVPADQAIIWRGPMLHSAVTQFIRDTAWGELDYLIIDMPPGTGDVALTLSQLLPLSGSVVVCTPQKVALLDAVKAIAMFRKVKIPLIGVVENMSGFLCPDNHKRYDIFGSGGARQMAEDANIPFLGDLPITLQMRERGDDGTTQDNLRDPQIAPYIDRIAYQVARRIADQTRMAPATPQLPVLG
ncbi:MAG: Mrp/NBP35 family ATP-binding protein [Planctomycetaceae bacterium]|nr:Mrp/NBP35 family ATP-binding protein [Planctomycetaceae bacterium]